MKKVVIAENVLSKVIPSKKEEDWGYKSFRIYNSLKNFGDVSQSFLIKVVVLNSIFIIT